MSAATGGDRIPGVLEALDDSRRRRESLVDDLSLLIAQRREDGASVRGLADEYGVAPSAIHTWTQRGRQLREVGVQPRTDGSREGAPGAVLPVWFQWILVASIILAGVGQIVDIVLALVEHG